MNAHLYTENGHAWEEKIVMTAQSAFDQSLPSRKPSASLKRTRSLARSVLPDHITRLSIDLSRAALVELVHTSRCGYAEEAQDQYSQAANRLVDGRVAQEQPRVLSLRWTLGIEESVEDAQESQDCEHP